MKRYALSHDIEGCIGCGACESICPDSWEMKENDAGELKAFAKRNAFDETERETNMEAAECCPVTVIHIKDSEGNELI